MTIAANYPLVKPSLLLDFANTKQLDPRITFTRASTANYYDGKTATLAEQNFLSNSQNYQSSWSWVSSTVTANTTTAPDGTTTASTMTGSAGTALKGVYNSNISGTVSGTNAYSVYCKAGTHTYAQFLFGGTSPASSAYANFDLQAGVVTASSGGTASITYAGNGWYRCSFVGDLTNFGSAYIAFADTPTATRAANSTSTNYFYIWGAQIEQRSTVSAYTPTTSAPITNYIPTLQSIASGLPRFDSNPVTGESLGLLIEESRTNLSTSSAVFNSPDWTKYNTIVAGNVCVAPDGTFTGSKIIADKNTGEHLITRTTASAATSATYSVYMKMAEYRYGAISVYSSALGTYAQGVFDLQAGTASTNYSGLTATITAVGDGWYRCSVSGFGSASGNIYAHFGPMPTSTYTNFTGDGYSGIYAWGAQLEAGSSATSYVATPLTFTSRASSGTYRGPNGFITSASTNVARNETNSVGTTNLLLEGAASNLLKYTDDFANSYWQQSNASIAVNQTQGPDGLVLADKLVEASGTGLYPQESTTNVAVSNSTAYTLSVYAKAGERSFIRLLNDAVAGGSASSAWFNLSTGVVVSQTAGVTASIQDVGGGWYRCSMTRTTAFTSMFCQFLMAPDASGNAYTGNGTSGLYLWGAQLEAGSTATSYIPSVETFSARSSAATYYNSSGVLASATSGTARTTYNPALLSAGGKLLLEPAATNLSYYSEQFDNAYWAKSNVSVTANTTTAPDGNATADKVYESTVNSSHVIYSSLATSFTSGTTYTFSVYVKAAGRTIFDLRQTSSVDQGMTFDLNSLTVTLSQGSATGTITNVGNGWYRCTSTFTVASTFAGTFVIYLKDASGNIAYAGDGSSGLYLWGAQCEAGSGATSYIATTSASVTRAADTSTSAAQSRSADVYSASTVTRAADTASMTGTNFSSWYRQSEGTLFADYVMNGLNNPNPGLAQGVFSMYDGIDYNNSISIQNQNNYSGSFGQLLVYANSVSQVDAYTASPQAAYTQYRLAGAYNPNDFAVSSNGAAVVTDNSGSLPTTLNTALIGYNYSGTSRALNGTIKKIAYYPKRLTNAQLKGLTT